MKAETRRRFAALARELGAELSPARRRRHVGFSVTGAGEQFFYPVPSHVETDDRTLLNCLTGLRRSIGARRAVAGGPRHQPAGGPRLERPRTVCGAAS